MQGIVTGVLGFVQLVLRNVFIVPAIVGASLLFTAQDALAQSTPVMPPVEFPMTPDSIADEIFAGGAIVIGLVFAFGLGFYLVRKLFKRLRGTI